MSESHWFDDALKSYEGPVSGVAAGVGTFLAGGGPGLLKGATDTANLVSQAPAPPVPGVGLPLSIPPKPPTAEIIANLTKPAAPKLGAFGEVVPDVAKAIAPNAELEANAARNSKLFGMLQALGRTQFPVLMLPPGIEDLLKGINTKTGKAYD